MEKKSSLLVAIILNIAVWAFFIIGLLKYREDIIQQQNFPWGGVVVVGLFLLICLIRDVKALITLITQKDLKLPKDQDIIGNELKRILQSRGKIKVIDVNQDTKKEVYNNSLTIRQPQFLTGVGIIGALVFGGIIVFLMITQYDPADLLGYLGFLLFMLASLLAAAYNFFWKIEVKQNEIHYKSIFKSKTYTVDIITKIEQRCGYSSDGSLIILYSGVNKFLSVKSSYKGYDLFVKYLKQRFNLDDLIYSRVMNVNK